VSVIIVITFQREGLVKRTIVASLSLLIFLLAACNFPSQSLTVIPTLTLTVPPTFVPTMTSLPSLPTPDAVSSLMPDGQSASEWNGIPIMPGAIAGEGDEESYVFTIKATPQQVADYYQAELATLGWQPFGTDNKDASLMLLFMDKDSATLTINIIAKGDDALVLLVK
jgi:hypothetical protein